MSLRDFITVLFGAGALGCLVFVTLYAWRSRGWQRVDTGRNLMAMMAVLLTLLALVTVSRWHGPFSPMVWTALLCLLDAVIWWRVIILWRRQHERNRS
jgi:hypothetical protein